MNFDFPEEIKVMRDQASAYLKQKDALGLSRRVLDGDLSAAMKLWPDMAEMGWTGLTIPEAYSGNEIGYLALCSLANEIGYAAAPLPFSSTLYLGAEAILLGGTDAQKGKWLPSIAEGRLSACFAAAEGLADVEGKGLKTVVRNGCLTGVKQPVTDGLEATLAIVLADSDGEANLYLVDLLDAGVSRRSVRTIDATRPQACIDFKDVPAEPLAGGAELIRTLYDRAAVLFAFEQVGGAQACLDMACNYAKGRYAFGRPIGSFQAIKHKLADMFVAIELARSNAYYAAWALSTNAPELPVAAATARISASKAFWLAAKENIQTHGGMGFSWEADCHLYYRRSKALSLAVGAQREWEDRLITGLEAGIAEL